jgi:hypothetical protein
MYRVDLLEDGISVYFTEPHHFLQEKIMSFRLIYYCWHLTLAMVHAFCSQIILSGRRS